MNLNFNTSLADGYKSASQSSRRLTEGWISENMYCPRCGHIRIRQFENNRPVADFYCEECKNEFELKSKSSALGKKIMDGAYDTMIKRITSNTNPDFFFLGYNPTINIVTDLIIVPKFFFVPDIIEKRKPLTSTARRAGWVGCSIAISTIPEQGRIEIIKNGVEISQNKVIEKLNLSTRFEIKNIEIRGWLLDVLNCVNSIKPETFDLQDMYSFITILSKKHPSNNNVEAKIRQQLQLLRDKNAIQFLGNGKYRKA